MITGTMITILFGAALPLDLPNYYDLMYLGFVAVVTFAGLFVMAIRQTRNPDAHRRYILFATIPWLPPGINRLYQNGFDLEGVPVLATYLTMDLLVAALLLNDWRTRRAFTRAGLVGAACVLIPQLLHYPIVESDTFVVFSKMLTDLVYYR